MTPLTKRLIAILVASLGVALLLKPSGTSPVPPGSTRPTARRAGSTPQAIPEEVVALRSAELETPPATSEVGRNPFRFYEPPPPPPAPPPRLSAEERAALAAPVVTLAPPTPPPPPKPRPPEIRFKYLGSFGPEGGRIAVFQDGDNLINARVGEVVLNKFRVAKIGYESADIEFVDFPDAPAQRLPVGR